jgi:hypothetical protein
LALVGGAYLLQLASPLRLNTDSIVFLSLAQSFLEGGGFVFEERMTHFPVGYPLIVATLDRVGIASSPAFICVNLLSVGAGLLALRYLLQHSFRFSSRAALMVLLMTMLSFVFIKHITIPLSDPPYFGLSMLCLLAGTLAIDRKGASRYGFFLAEAALAIAAISIRTVGISLIPSVLYSILPTSFFSKLRLSEPKANKLVAWSGLSLFALLSVVSFVIIQSKYFQEAAKAYREASFVRLLVFKLYDWGELVTNIPVSVLPSVAYPLVLVLGATAFILIQRGFWLCRHTLNIVDIYAFVYLGLLILWPYRDARFWLPILPLLIAYVIKSLENILQFSTARWAARVYVTAFGLLGVLALGYSTWISFSGNDFPDRYGDYATRQTYQTAFGGTRAIDQDKVDCIGVRVLNRYEWRASHPCPSKP